MFNLNYQHLTTQGQKACDKFFDATFKDYCIRWTKLYGADLSMLTFKLRICHVILEILRLNCVEEYNMKGVPLIAYIVSETKDYYLYANKIATSGKEMGCGLIGTNICSIYYPMHDSYLIFNDVLMICLPTCVFKRIKIVRPPSRELLPHQGWGGGE